MQVIVRRDEIDRTMGFFPDEIQKADLRHGDHVFYYPAKVVHSTEMRLYSHHGIYDKDSDRVIHFDWKDHSWMPEWLLTGKNYARCSQCQDSKFGVRKSCLSCFMHGERRPLHRCEYGQGRRDVLFHDAGSRSTQPGDPPELVLKRARDAYDDNVMNRPNGQWNGPWTLAKNCESFAYYCKTGISSKGKQMKRALVLAPLAAIVA